LPEVNLSSRLIRIRAHTEDKVSTEKHSLILFDGVCNFCNSAINFYLLRDKKDAFRFAPLQSIHGEKVLTILKEENRWADSIILVENEKIYTKSTAALRALRKLSGAWPLLYGFIIVPRFIRDFVYDIIARNRYKWWGKKDACMVPTPEQRKKFLT
jgi:predicted DCC family thiol-disulfide oxidoreductase YuxK